MEVIKPDNTIVNKLNEMNMEKHFLNTFLHSDFLVLEEKDDKIMGVCSVGGLFHIGGIFVSEQFRGTGLGSKLNLFRDKELRKRNYSFFVGTTYTTNPSAPKISKILKERNARPVFSFAYHENFRTTLFIQEFNRKGRIFGKFLNIFNTKFGNLCLALILKSSQKFWKKLFLAESSNYNKINIRFCLKNFQKLIT